MSKPASGARSGWRCDAYVAFLVLASGLFCIGLILWDTYPTRSLRDLYFDAQQRAWPRAYDPDGGVRVIAIDDASLERLGQWPWPRARLAELIEKLRAAGAAAIVIDVLLSEPEREPGSVQAMGDELLAKAIAPGRVVLGFALADVGGKPMRKAGFASTGDDPRAFVPRYGGALLPLVPLREAAAGIGAMNWVPDRDLVVRQIPTVFVVGDALVPSLDLEALRVAQDASTVLVRSSNASGDTAFGRATGISRIRTGNLEAATGRDGSVRVHFAGTRGARRIPAWTVLDGSADPGLIGGAIVLIGATATALSDIRATPLEPAVPGIDIRAEVIENLAAGSQLVRPDWMPGVEAAMTAAGTIVAFAAASLMAPLAAWILVAFLTAAMIAASISAFVGLHILLDPIWPSVGTIAAFGLTSLGVLRLTERERRQVREAFSRYLPPAVVETLARDPARLVLGGETRTLTIMFSDIRGFTSRSEQLSAEEVVAFLNSVHTPLTEHVLDSGGTLDKFIGDGMMAFWNAPLPVPDHTRQALRAALKMQATVEAQERARPAGSEGAALAIGIGLHLGPACVGNIGSTRRFDYSAIGDAVNTAARIEPLCKTYGVGILASQEVADAAPDFAFLGVGPVRLRGQQREGWLHALVGDESVATPAFQAFRAEHDRAVALMAASDPAGLRQLRALARHPMAATAQGLYRALGAASDDRAKLSA